MRSAVRTVAGAGALGMAILAAPVPARAEGEFVRVIPSTVQAGFQIEIEGFCNDNINPAEVRSDAFGVVTITPTPDPKDPNRFLHRGTATIPTDKRPRGYSVNLSCPSERSATTTLHVVNFNVPAQGPHTGGGGLANNSLPANVFTLAGVGGIALGSLLLLLRRRKT